MKNHDGFWRLAILTALIVAAIAFDYWIINAVIGSDLPDWLKILILRS